HRGLQYRRGIRQAGGLQDHAAKNGAAVVEIAQQLLERIDEVATQGAAEAATLQKDDALSDWSDQEMIEPDLAELVDDDRGLGERWIGDQSIEQRGLAGAEEAGQHGEWNRFGRAQT